MLNDLLNFQYCDIIINAKMLYDGWMEGHIYINILCVLIHHCIYTSHMQTWPACIYNEISPQRVLKPG